MSNRTKRKQLRTVVSSTGETTEIEIETEENEPTSDEGTEEAEAATSPTEPSPAGAAFVSEDLSPQVGDMIGSVEGPVEHVSVALTEPEPPLATIDARYSTPADPTEPSLLSATKDLLGVLREELPPPWVASPAAVQAIKEGLEKSAAAEAAGMPAAVVFTRADLETAVRSAVQEVVKAAVPQVVGVILKLVEQKRDAFEKGQKAAKGRSDLGMVATEFDGLAKEIRGLTILLVTNDGDEPPPAN